MKLLVASFAVFSAAAYVFPKLIVASLILAILTGHALFPVRPSSAGCRYTRIGGHHVHGQDAVPVPPATRGWDQTDEFRVIDLHGSVCFRSSSLGGLP